MAENDQNLPATTGNSKPQPIIDILANTFEVTARTHGIDEEFLSKKLRRELGAKERRAVLVKGELDPGEQLPVGWKVLGVFRDIDGSRMSLVEQRVPDFKTRQKAREGAHRLFRHVKEDGGRGGNQTLILVTQMPNPDPLPPPEGMEDAMITGAEEVDE